MARTKSKKDVEEKKNGLEAPSALKILVTICERSKADFYLSALEGFKVNMQMVVYADGTDHLRLQETVHVKTGNKAVIFSCVEQSHIKEILDAYEERFFKTRNGKGIAFTIPVSSIIGVTIYKFLANC